MRVASVDWTVGNITIEIRISTGESDWILRGPLSNPRIKISPSKAVKLCVSIINPPCKAKRLEAGIAVLQHSAELVVVHPLDNFSSCHFNDQPRTTQVIRDDAIDLARLFHVFRHIDFVGIDKAADNVVVAL